MYNMDMKLITSLPLSLRPREKLLKQGVDALSLEELISVILVTGTSKTPVSTLSSKISFVTRNKNFTKDDLTKIGIGSSKTAQILAARELGKRLLIPDAAVFTSPEQIYANSHDIIKKNKESLLCFYLNARGELLKKELVAVGSLNKVHLLPREIFILIKELPVASIILVHNHPSGTLEPSIEDIRFTHRVKLAADILGISLLDHLIVSEAGWKRIVF